MQMKVIFFKKREGKKNVQNCSTEKTERETLNKLLLEKSFINYAKLFFLCLLSEKKCHQNTFGVFQRKALKNINSLQISRSKT